MRRKDEEERRDLDPINDEIGPCESRSSEVSNLGSIELPHQSSGLVRSNSLHAGDSWFQVVSAEPPNHLTQWFIIRSPQDSEIPPEFESRKSIPIGLIANWFCSCQDSAEAGQPMPRAKSVTIAVESALDIGKLLLTFKGVCEKRLLGEILFGTLRSQLCWYWRGDAHACLREFADMGPFRCGWIEINQHELHDSSIAGGGEKIEFSNTWVMILVGMTWPGYIIKPLLDLPTTHAIRLQLAPQESVAAAEIQDSELGALRPVIFEAVKSTQANWMHH